MMLKRGMLLFLRLFGEVPDAQAVRTRPGRPVGRQVEGRVGVGRDEPVGMGTPGGRTAFNGVR